MFFEVESIGIPVQIKTILSYSSMHYLSSVYHAHKFVYFQIAHYQKRIFPIIMR